MQPDQSSELYRFLAQNGAFNLGSASCGGFPAAQSFSSSSSYYPLESPAAAMEPPPPSPHDRALAALKNHKEAEKRRRERINSHLDKLRALLPCNSKVINFYSITYLIFRNKNKLKTLPLLIWQLYFFLTQIFFFATYII